MQWGPQPFEGMVSDVCQAFGIPPTPGSAVDQDYALVLSIMDYRTAAIAVETFNGPDKGVAFDTLVAHPRLAEVLAMMQRAQDGLPLYGATVQEGLRVADANRTQQEQDDGG